ncbi:MAG: hypothetical protein OQJ95_01345 [Kangiella sp.]|jgi:hypothetical protein|nr:hypothetical protein [Kangiella sp.]
MITTTIRLSLLICCAIILTACGARTETAQSKLRKLDKEYNVDLDKIDFYVKDTNVGGKFEIKITPSKPVQNTTEVQEILFKVWHQIAKENCNGKYIGEPELKIGMVQRGDLDAENVQIAIKMLVTHVYGEAECQE